MRENRVTVQMHVEGMPRATGPVIDIDPTPDPDGPEATEDAGEDGSGLSGR